jgi:lipoate-protein ligase A
MSLYRLPFQKESGAQNMATDMWLLQKVDQWKGPIFRRYGWSSPQVTFGYGQKATWVEQETGIDIKSIIRRPTGGGIVRHGTDLTYCLIAPKGSKGAEMAPMDFYAQVHRRWGVALSEEGIVNCLMPCPQKSTRGIPGDCFSEPVGRDLMDENGTKKLGGAAMKRTRQGVLLQGTLELSAWPDIDHSKIENRFVELIASDLEEGVIEKAWPNSLENERNELVRIYGSFSWNRDRKVI